MTPTSTLPSQSLAASTSALDGLRASAQKDPKGALREASRQFEALFMQQLLKSMRATSLSSGMLDNSGTELGTEMLDQQYARQLTGQPGGLADAIMRQLERQIGTSATSAGGSTTGSTSTGSISGATAASRSAGRTLYPHRPVHATAPLAQSTVGLTAANLPQASQQALQFVRQNEVAAQKVAEQSGIPASFMLAQAAHETGWGRKQISQADGTPSHNLFGIKADSNWKGAVVEASTVEVIGGVAQRVKARFRAYSSPEEAFRDYARLIGNSPRYQGVMQTAIRAGSAGNDGRTFAQGLQRAGYATDPNYADKLGRVINTTLRLQRLTV
ncbi:MAG: hypothetical protein RJA44_779 [Pseudomonadota bacterium]